MLSSLNNWRWNVPEGWMKIETIDLHTGGEPLRVIVNGVPNIEGTTILEKRRFFRANFDHIRTGIMFEPRGHADMYGAVLTEPVSDDADLGVFFMHNEGYSTMCGHAIIAITKLVLDTAIIDKPGSHPKLVFDAPPGKIYATAVRDSLGKVTNVSFNNVPSFVLLQNEEVVVEDIGKLKFDVAYGGAFYAFVNADEVNLQLNASYYNQLIDLGRRIKHAVRAQWNIQHPVETDLSFLYGTIFTGKAENRKNHSRNVCVFAEGEVDRSATGSGVSARAALLHEKGGLPIGEKVTIESILGSTMDVEVVESCVFHGHAAVIPRVSGQAWITGQNTFCFDPADPFNQGFIFR